MMVSDDCLVECPIDEDEDDEEDPGGEEKIHPPPPPPEFASKPPPSPDAPPTLPATPTPINTVPATPTQINTDPANRDPYGINQHLKVEASDVLAEPMSPHSMDRVWVYSVVGFEAARLWTYRCLSLLLAVPLALLSGILLALLAFLHIWCVMPCIQLSQTFLPCFRSLWMCVVNILIFPFCSSVARCCSQIAISLSKDQLLMSDKLTA